MKKKTIWGCGILAGIIGIIFMILIILALLALSYNDDGSYYEDRSWVFNSTQKIDSLTGIQLPEFDVLKYKQGKRDFFGDYSDTLIVRFRSVNTDSISMLLNKYNNLQKWTDRTRYDYYSKQKDYAIFLELNKDADIWEIVYFTW